MSDGIGTKFDKVCSILDKYEHNPHKLIAILQDMQEEYKYLPEDIMTFVSTALGISPSTVYGVATFYSHFTLQPKGKHVIKLCDGTACHVRKSQDILMLLRSIWGSVKKAILLRICCLHWKLWHVWEPAALPLSLLSMIRYTVL